MRSLVSVIFLAVYAALGFIASRHFRPCPDGGRLGSGEFLQPLSKAMRSFERPVVQALSLQCNKITPIAGLA
jgi:hypothetical protein